MTDAELLEEERKKKEAAATAPMVNYGGGTEGLIASFEESLLRGQNGPSLFDGRGIAAGKAFANSVRGVQPQAPVTFRDYSVPESPRASGLSVFTPSGEVKPGVDVSAITTAPETLPAPSEVNTALNQEVQVDSPSVEVQQPKPGFFKPGGFGYEYLGGRLGENLGEFAGRQLYGTGITAEGEATGFPVDRPSLAGDLLTLPGTALNVAGDLIVDPLVAGGEMVKDFAGYATGATGVEAQQEAAQAATGASASEATPSATPTVETPSGGAQGQQGASTPQGTFSTSPISIDPSVTAPISAEEFANLPVPEGTPAPVTIQGAEGTGYQKAPEGMVKAMSPEGKMVFATPDQANQMNADYAAENAANIQAQKDFLGSQAGRDFSNRMLRSVIDSPYSRESAAREARLEARPDFGDAVSDRDRRAARGEGISMADRTAMAKANARGASPSDIARGNKIADELGVDLKTGQPLQPAGGLTFEQQIALSKEQRAGREEVRSVAEQEREWEQTQGEARQERMDEMNTEIGALTSIIGQAENISGVATEAGRQVGAGTAGFFSPLKWIGGTTAADLAGNLETIKSDAFVANITEMRQNSPTGGAVGNVSDKDLEMLQSLQTSFRQNLKPTTLKNNLKKYKEIRDKVARDAKAGFIRKYGAENFNTYFGDQQQGGTQASPIPNDRDSNTQVDPELQQYFN